MIAAVLQRGGKAKFTGYISWQQDPCQRKFRLFTTMRPKLGQQRNLMSGHARQVVAGRNVSHVKLPSVHCTISATLANLDCTLSDGFHLLHAFISGPVVA